MPSYVDIANSALIKLGEDLILSLDDNVKSARTLKAIYEMRRDALIRNYNWNFAMKRANLAALTTSPEHAYTYEYQKPADFLRMIQVNDVWVIPGYADFIGGPDEEPYKIEGDKIRTDYSSPLKVRYLSRVTDPSQFDAAFVELYAYDLAFEACETITQSNTKKDGLRSDKKDALLMAMRSNAIENPPAPIADDSWLAAKNED